MKVEAPSPSAMSSNSSSVDSGYASDLKSNTDFCLVSHSNRLLQLNLYTKCSKTFPLVKEIDIYNLICMDSDTLLGHICNKCEAKVFQINPLQKIALWLT